MLNSVAACRLLLVFHNMISITCMYCMVGLFLTIIALWQRKNQLLSFGYKDGWAASTFPFCNTAIAAGLYYSAHKNDNNHPSSMVLQLWVWILSITASTIVFCVNIMFIYHSYYLSVPIVIPPVVGVDNSTDDIMISNDHYTAVVVSDDHHLYSI